MYHSRKSTYDSSDIQPIVYLLYRLYYFSILTTRYSLETINMRAVPITDVREVSLKDSVIYFKINILSVN